MKETIAGAARDLPEEGVRLTYDLLATDPSLTEVESAFVVQAEAVLGE